MKREDGGRGSTLADLDAHGGGGRGTAPLIPLARAHPGHSARPQFHSIAMTSDTPLGASRASLNHPTQHLLSSPTPQTRGQLDFALYLVTADYFLCLRREIDVAALNVESVSGTVASARNVE